MIDLRRLRVLRAVAHYGTITAAAKAMHFTTSAASQQIRQLGRELDVVLLEPQGRRVRLTPAARSLLGHADAIEARWEQAEVDLRAGRDEPAGLVRLTGFPTAVAMLLAPLVAPLRARYPRLAVRIAEAEAVQQNAFDLVFDGDADLAIVEAIPSNPPLTDARFDQQPLLDDVFDLVVPVTHPFANRPHVALVEVADAEWVLPSSSCTCREHTLAACGAAGFTPNIVHNALEWNAIAHLVAHDLGVAMIPRLAYLPPHLPIKRLPLHGNPSPSRKLLTCTRSGGREHPAIAAVLAELHEAMAA